MALASGSSGYVIDLLSARDVMIHSGTDIRVKIYRYLLCQSGHFLSYDPDDDIGSDEIDPMYPAILRVNRQINAEAQNTLYSEQRVIIDPGGIKCLQPGSDITRPRHGVWRHNPLHGIGRSNTDGTHTYDTPEIYGKWNPTFSRVFSTSSLPRIFNSCLGHN